MQYTDLAIARPAAEIRYRARAKSVGPYRLLCGAKRVSNEVSCGRNRRLMR
jgi:hypothetical protein